MQILTDKAGRTPKEFYFLLVLVTAFFLLNLHWVWLYRHDGLFDIDEAGYFGFSVIDYYGAHFGGIRGWLSAIDIPSIQAPFLTAVTSILFIIFGVHPILGFVVTISFASLAVCTAAAIGTTIRSPQAGLIAALLTASCPLIITFSRSFQFSTAATFTTALAVLAMLRSRRFTRVVWALAFGIALGLMPLSRTMTIAFVPGVILAGLICVLGERAQLARRLALFAGSLVLAVAVAMTWFATNGPLVFHYLFSFGYGKKALEYGRATSKFGVDAWIQTVHTFIQEFTYLPFFLAVCLALVIGIGVLICHLRASGIKSGLVAIARSPAFLVFIIAAEQLTALASSSNQGSGFFAPLIPLLSALMGYSFTAIPFVRRHQRLTLGLVSLFVLLLWLPLIELIPVLSKQYVVSFPVLGDTIVSDGRGTIQSDEARAGYGAPGALAPVSPAQAREWQYLSDKVAEYLAGHYGKDIRVAWGFRNELFNVNTVQLSNLIHRDSAFAATMIDPTTVTESRPGYSAWLKQACSSHCILLTSDRVSGDFQPPVNPLLMTAAARERGFIPVKNWVAPDEQVITLWAVGAH